MSAVISAAVIAAVGTGYSIYAGERGRRDQKRAQRRALADARRQEATAEQEFNRSNRRQPNLQALLEANRGAGIGGTLLGG